MTGRGIAFGLALAIVIWTFVPASIQTHVYATSGISASSGTTTYNTGGDAVQIDSGLLLAGFTGSNSISSARVMIQNKQVGDILSFTSQNGITGNYNSSTGILTLSGSATQEQYQTALRTITFSTTSSSLTNRAIDFMIGSGLYCTATGHFYEYISVGNSITWDAAVTAASNSALYGRKGYLVTITSEEENKFVKDKTLGLGWIGAKDVNYSQSNPWPYSTGDWRWVTGPEGLSDSGKGAKFYNGFWANGAYHDDIGTRTVVNGEYANWASGEPNNYNNDEYVAHIYGPGSNHGLWNDYNPTNGSATGYIVEYGGMEENPMTIQASKTIQLYDTKPPQVSNKNLTASGVTGDTVVLSWNQGSDDVTSAGALQYKVVSSLTSNISSTSDALSNGATVMDWTTTTSKTVTGLTADTLYYFNVLVKDAVGNVTGYTTLGQRTDGIPAAPIITGGIPGDCSIGLTFTAPDDNGSSILYYTATASPGSITATGSGTTVTISGLTNGTAYTFTVTATNAIGTGPESLPSDPYLPGTVPGAPGNIQAAAGNGQATISFDPPSSSGGAVISSYIVTASPGGITASGIGSPITFTGLANGTSYTFTVVAVNSFGQSPSSSESAPVTPAVPPSRSRSVDSNVVTSTINGQSVQIGTSTTETNGEQTQTVLNVNPTTISNLANTMPQGSTLVLPTYTGTGNGTVDGTKVGMTLGLVDQLFHQDIALQIDTGQIAYTLPANSIDIPTLLTKFEGNVPESQVTFDITISDVPTKMLEVVQNTAAKDEFAIVIPPVEFNVTATYNGQTVSVNQFSQHVSREIALPAGTDPKKITTAIVVKEDGTTYHVPTDVYQKDGQWYARISSLTNSVYTLIYNEATFADTKGRWFEAPVAEAASRTILNGYADGTFRGTNPITRAEFAAMIVNTLGLDRVGTSNYPDVKDANWFYGVVSRASEYKVVSGRLNGNFDPNAYITRQEAMIMMQRAGEICGLVPGEGNAAANPAANEAAVATAASSTAATLSNDYADQATISTWAREAVEYNLNVGLMKGSNGQLKPRDNITRAEAAVTILRLLQKSHLIDPRSAV